tara:strand:- start:2579 stop:4189 length:1611 start_codon:yes stop_codon:yes gene_type:complete
MVSPAFGVPQFRTVNGVTEIWDQGTQEWVPYTGQGGAGAGKPAKYIPSPMGSNRIHQNYQIIDLFGFAPNEEGQFVDPQGTSISDYGRDWTRSRYGIDAPFINQGPNKNTNFETGTGVRFVYFDPNTRMWNALNDQQIAQLPEGVINQNSMTNRGQTAPGVNLFYNPGTELFDAQPQTIRAYYGQPEYTAEDVIYRADPASVYDTYDPYAPFERTDPYENVGTLLNTRYPYTPPTGPTPTTVYQDPAVPEVPDITPVLGGDPGGGIDPLTGDETSGNFADERSKNLDFLLSRAQQGLLGQADPARLDYLMTVDPDRLMGKITEEQYNALKQYQANAEAINRGGLTPTGGVMATGGGQTFEAPAFTGYESDFMAANPRGMASDKQVANLQFLLGRAADPEYTLSAEQKDFLNRFDRRRYDDAVLAERDALKAQGLFAGGGGVASLYRDVDSQVTGQGLESFLQRRSDTVNKMLAQQAMNVPRGTMPVPMNQGGDVTITERTVRDPRDNQYVMEERVVRKQMAFDPDMQTGVMSTLYG